MRRRIRLGALLALVTMLLVATPVFAIVYRAQYTVTNNGTTSYPMLPVSVSIDNQWMADNGFMESSANDTRIETLGGLEQPHMVTDNATMTAVPVPANSQTNLYFTTGNTPLDNFYIIPGYDGYVTVADEASIELGDNFTSIIRGWIDTDNGSNKNLVNKTGAFRTYVSDTVSGNITSEVLATANVTPFSSTSDSHITKTDATYSTAREAASGSSAPTSAEASIGQQTGYTVRRTFYYFDTSAIPDDASITSAELKLYGQQDSSATDFDIVIQNGQPTYPSDPIADTDYNMTYYSGNGGSYNTAGGWSTTSYNTIPLNDDGLDWINKTGTTKLCLRSSRDINGNTPTEDEYVIVYTRDQTGDSQDPYIIVNYAVSDAAVTATSVSSGIHTIETTANTSHLLLYIDGTLEDSTALTANVTDNSANLTFLENNVMPYSDNISISVNGTQRLWFDPNAIIVGTNLPDRSGNSHNGTFHWGASPAGVSVALGSLVSSGQPTPGAGVDQPTEDILPEVGVTDWFVDPDVTGSLLTNPIRPFVTILSDTTTLTELQAWRLLALAFVLFITVLVAKNVRGHQGITAIAGGATWGGMVTLTIFPMWTLVFAIGAIVGGLVSERSPHL